MLCPNKVNVVLGYVHQGPLRESRGVRVPLHLAPFLEYNIQFWCSQLKATEKTGGVQSRAMRMIKDLENMLYNGGFKVDP